MDENNLLIYEVDVVQGKPALPKQPDSSSPFRLKASIVNAASGKVISVKEWPTSIRGSWIDTTVGGILVRTGTTLRMLSKDFAEVQNITLSEGNRAGSHWDIWFINVSSTGRTIMVNRINQTANVSRFDILDGSTFKLRCSWSESPGLYNSYSISDIGIVTTEFHPVTQVLLTEFGSRTWKAIITKPKEGGLGAPTMLSDDQIFLQIVNRLSVLGHDGRSDELYALKDETIDQRISVSRDSRFVAASINTFEIKKHIFSETTWHEFPKEIAVFGLSTKKEALMIPIEPLPKNDYDFALSPDGSKLAVLDDRKVSVYSVPVQFTEHADTVGSKDSTPHVQVPIPGSKQEQ